MTAPSDKPGYDQPFPIIFTLWDAGCLRGLLTARIAEVETAGNALNAEQREYNELFLGQLKGCLDAVRQAQAAFVHGH